MTDSVAAGGTAEQVKKLVRVFASVTERGGDVQALARAAGLSVAVTEAALSDAEAATQLADAYEEAEESGRLLKPAAVKLSTAMLRKLSSAMDADELDIDDIDRLLPKVHRVIEHADRMDVARGNQYDNLPVINIIFGAKGGMSARTQPATLLQVAGERDVFDIADAAPSPAMSSTTDINADVIDWVDVGDSDPAPEAQAAAGGNQVKGRA